jgi:hypothetical protein
MAAAGDALKSRHVLLLELRIASRGQDVNAASEAAAGLHACHLLPGQ